MGFGAVRSSEWVSFGYFAGLSTLTLLRPLPAARRLQIAAAGASACVAIAIVARWGSAGVRDWAPGVCILAGYYLAARFFVHPFEPLEAWLRSIDRRLLGDPATRFSRWPRALVAYLEIVYVYCFLLVPGGLAALMLAGRAELADRYWTIVGGAALGSYAPLAVLPTRPPWRVEQTAALPDAAVHRFAARMVNRFTTRANTFPSGHVAASLAVALAVADSLQLAGVIFFVLALSIALACVVGRYHYVADAVAGALLAVGIWAAVELVGR
jgi:membrane-associated phospholipid phosphatase